MLRMDKVIFIQTRKLKKFQRDKKQTKSRNIKSQFIVQMDKYKMRKKRNKDIIINTRKIFINLIQIINKTFKNYLMNLMIKDIKIFSIY